MAEAVLGTANQNFILSLAIARGFTFLSLMTKSASPVVIAYIHQVGGSRGEDPLLGPTQMTATEEAGETSSSFASYSQIKSIITCSTLNDLFPSYYIQLSFCWILLESIWVRTVIYLK